MVFLKQKNKYYSLHQEPHEKPSAWSYLWWPILFPRWIFSLPLARAVTNIALSPTQIKKQEAIHFVSLSDDPINNSAVLVDLLPQEPNKLFHDFLVSTSFVSTLKKRKLTYLNDDDKRYVEKMLAEVEKLIQNQSSAGKTFNLDDIYFKGIEYFDEALRYHFFEELEKRSGKAPNLRNSQFDFFSLETTDAAVLDSVSVTCPTEENKPMSERKFVISCLPSNQNYINRLTDFRHLAQQIDCTVIGFNYRGVCDSTGVIWTQDNAVDDVLSQVQRLLMMGVNPKNICLEGHGIGGAIATLAAAQLQEVKLFSACPFRSLSQYIASYIFPNSQSSLWYPVTWLRYFIGAFVYLLMVPLLWIIGWQMDVERAWNKIPQNSKTYMMDKDRSDLEAQALLDNQSISVIADGIKLLFEQESTSSLSNSETSAAITQKPFLIASSGGAGHISAMMGLIDDMRLQKSEIDIPLHQAQLDQDKKKSHLGFVIRAGVYVMSIQYIGYAIKCIAKAVGYPAMPNSNDFWQEFNKLNQTESAKNLEQDKVEGRQRPYVDLILDTYPDGYEAIALFNSLQRSENMDDLCRVASKQDYSDQWHYQYVYDYVLTTLNNALEIKVPFTEIKSTQIGSIDAICDAVAKYNSDLSQANQKYSTVFPPIEIHQYFTEFSVPEATHFLKPVLKLTPKQRQLVHIHAVNLTPAVQFAYLDNGLGFKGMHPIELDRNPMVRGGFKDEALITYLDNTEACSLHIKTYSQLYRNWIDKGKETIEITANEKVASIMLSSQATIASVAYVKEYLEKDYDKIFVFGGLNQNIYDGINKLINDYPENDRNKIEQRIIRLGNQTDKEMGPILSRSNDVVSRSGGLSMMELAAIPLSQTDKSKKFFIHQPPNETNLSWEEGNANCFIRHMRTKGFFASKASPETIRGTLNLRCDNDTGVLGLGMTRI